MAHMRHVETWYDVTAWTGANQAEVSAAVGRNRGGGEWFPQVREDGSVYLSAGTMDWVLIPADHTFVSGPHWGTNQYAGTAYEVIPTSLVSERFTGITP